MKYLATVLLVLLCAAAFAQITVTGGDTGTFDKPGKTSKIEPGSFGEQEFFISLAAGKNGNMVVGGRINDTTARKPITGKLLPNGRLVAKILDGAQTVIEGYYNQPNDTIVITRVGSEKMNDVLERRPGGIIGPATKKPIQPGQYSGRSAEPEGDWELTITKSKSTAFTVTGTITLTLDGKRIPVKGILRKDGTISAFGGDEAYTINGSYDFTGPKISLRISGHLLRTTAILSPGPLKHISVFGLVSKQVGNVPGPGEGGDHKVSGSITESTFEITMEMKPPAQGMAKMTHTFSGNFGSTLKPGQIVELSSWSESEKSGRDAPGIGSTGWWIVEGDGAQVTETTKQFIGTASDGKHYPSGRGKTVFRVLGSGTIKITAVYTGQYWGGSGIPNWNPCTYIFKFREPAKASVGGG